MNDPYRVLGLAAGATAEEIVSAYRKLARRYPPELNPRRFAEIQRAYRMLTELDRLMEEAFEHPTQVLEGLYPPATVRLRPPPELPPRLQLDDFEPLLGILRRDLLRRLLRDALPPAEHPE